MYAQARVSAGSSYTERTGRNHTIRRMKMQGKTASVRQNILSATLPQHGSTPTAPTYGHSTSTSYCKRCLSRQPSPFCCGAAHSLCSHSHVVSAKVVKISDVLHLNGQLLLRHSVRRSCHTNRTSSISCYGASSKTNWTRTVPDVLTLRLSATMPRPKLPIAPRWVQCRYSRMQPSMSFFSMEVVHMLSRVPHAPTEQS